MGNREPAPVSDPTASRDAGTGSEGVRRNARAAAPLVLAFQIGRRLNRLEWNQRQAVFCGSQSHEAAATKDLIRLQNDLTCLFPEEQ